LILPAFSWFVEIGFFHFCDFINLKQSLLPEKLAICTIIQTNSSLRITSQLANFKTNQQYS
jgi:hypothetical protein